MKDIFGLFASPRLLKIVSEAIAYSFRVLFKHWVRCLLIGVVIGIVLTILSPNREKMLHSPYNYLLCLLAGWLPTVYFIYRRETTSVPKLDGRIIAVTECIYVATNEFLITNLETQGLNQKMSRTITSLNQLVFPYNSELFTAALLKRPKLFYLLNDLDSLKKNYQSHVDSGQIASLLMITFNAQSKKLDFEVILKEEDYFYKSAFEDLNFPAVLDKATVVENYIISVVSVFFALHGQSMLDISLDFGNMAISHKMVDDNETLFMNAMEELKRISPDENQKNLEIYEQLYHCSFERYRGILFLNQKEYLAAIRHLFKAMSIHSYYPYKSYNEFRETYQRKQGAAIAEQMIEVNKLLEESDLPLADQKNAKLQSTSAELLARTPYAETPLFEDILMAILTRANEIKIQEALEHQLATDFCKSPLKELIRAQVIRYIPKGTLMHNQVYVERIPEVIQLYKQVLELDKDFVVINNRIAGLLFVQMMYTDNKAEMERLLQESTTYFSQGVATYARYGMHERE